MGKVLKMLLCSIITFILVTGSVAYYGMNIMANNENIRESNGVTWKQLNMFGFKKPSNLEDTNNEVIQQKENKKDTKFLAWNDKYRMRNIENCNKKKPLDICLCVQRHLEKEFPNLFDLIKADESTKYQIFIDNTIPLCHKEQRES